MSFGMTFPFRYEFIAVGVVSGEFDEIFIKECFIGGVFALEKRAYLFVQSAQKQNAKTLESTVALVDRWSDQSR
jgi:hypothetical protein